jgi:hypothetical protein
MLSSDLILPPILTAHFGASLFLQQRTSSGTNLKYQLWHPHLEVLSYLEELSCHCRTTRSDHTLSLLPVFLSPDTNHYLAYMFFICATLAVVN